MFYTTGMKNGRWLLSPLTILWLWPLLASAQTAPWSTATTIDPISHQIVAYGRLQDLGDGRYFRLTLIRPVTLRVELAVPTSSVSRFQPQLAVFSADTVTAGPLLPIQQPPETLGLIYPPTAAQQVWDPYTQAGYNLRLAAQPRLPAGTSYLAVYNAGGQAGRYRLVVDAGSTLIQWSDAWMFPVRWWQDQQFAGFSASSSITPLLLALVIWTVWLRLKQHGLHPSAVTASRKKTKP